MSKQSNEEFRILSQDIRQAVVMGDAKILIDVLEEFESAMVQRCPPRDVAEDVLNALRSGKHFEKLCRLADACLDAGLDRPFVRRQYAQGMIELGLLHQALRQLNELHGMLRSHSGKHFERSEVLGLLGRTYKQRFVRFRKDREKAAIDLAESIRHYKEGYDLDPAWHGPNLVALVHRAEHEGLSPGETLRSEDVAARVLDDLRKLPEEKRTFWTSAAIGETSMALKDWDMASKSYGEFAQHKDTDAFALASAARNLREIWDIEPGEEHPSATILMALEAKTLTTGKGQIGYSPRDLPQVANLLEQSIENPNVHLDAILGENRQVDLRTMLTLIETAPAVCQVVNRHLYAARRKSGGTGFLVDGGVFTPEWRGKPVLVTNNHVLSRYGSSPSVKLSDADAVFHFWNRSFQEKIFHVKILKWESPREELDVTLALLEDPDEILNNSKSWLKPNLLNDVLGPANSDPPGKVYLIGHPDGRGIEFSLSDNTLIDHDLLDNSNLPYRRIHYKAPTEKGMSGSPVFCENGMGLIGLHRAGGELEPLRTTRQMDEYKANEAVWFESVRREATKSQGFTDSRSPGADG